MSKPQSAPGFMIEPRNRYFEAIRAIVQHEMRPENTVSFVAEVDLTEIEAIRRRPGGRKPSYTAFVVKAVALALRDFPYANRRVTRRPWLPFGGWRLQRFERCDIAVASEREVPGAESVAFFDMIRDADARPLEQITDALYALARADATNNAQWREFSGLIDRFPLWLASLLIRMPCYIPSLWVKYRGGAVLISSPAKYGVDVVAGTWSHPLGISFGLVKARPVVRDGVVVPATTFALSLNFDRRVMAGAQSARFFRRIIERLERAESELSPPWTPSEASLAEPAASGR